MMARRSSASVTPLRGRSRAAGFAAAPVSGRPSRNVRPFVVQVRLVVGAAAVHAIEIESRSPEVDERVRIVLPLQAARGIERQVVIDELAQICIRCWDTALLGIGSVLRRIRIGGHLGGEDAEGLQ